MIMINQMTSNTSAEVFVKMMGQARLFPVRTMCWGVKLMIGYQMLLLFGSKQIGMLLDVEGRWFGLGVLCTTVVMFLWFLKCLAYGVRSTYRARFFQKDQYALDRFPNARERVLQKTKEEHCSTMFPTETLKEADPHLKSASGDVFIRTVSGNVKVGGATSGLRSANSYSVAVTKNEVEVDAAVGTVKQAVLE
mmetsp:Transcript_30534/g.76821  ORF Transcript_30534/g.76821 Transcript_30534/m.76821 type:complete len:193 (-) Transcript_30534:22-600(-)